MHCNRKPGAIAPSQFPLTAAFRRFAMSRNVPVSLPLPEVRTEDGKSKLGSSITTGTAISAPAFSRRPHVTVRNMQCTGHSMIAPDAASRSRKPLVGLCVRTHTRPSRSMGRPHLKSRPEHPIPRPAWTWSRLMAFRARTLSQRLRGGPASGRPDGQSGSGKRPLDPCGPQTPRTAIRRGSCRKTGFHRFTSNAGKAAGFRDRDQGTARASLQGASRVPRDTGCSRDAG